MDTTYLTEFYGDVITARAYIFGIGFGAALILGACELLLFISFVPRASTRAFN